MTEEQDQIISQFWLVQRKENWLFHVVSVDDSDFIFTMKYPLEQNINDKFQENFARKFQKLLDLELKKNKKACEIIYEKDDEWENEFADISIKIHNKIVKDFFVPLQLVPKDIMVEFEIISTDHEPEVLN